MPKPRTQGGARKGAGRKPLSHYGLERRNRKVLASFTESELAALERAADTEGLTIAELVAQRALSVQ